MAMSESLDIQKDIVNEIKGLVSYLHDVYIEGDKEEIEVSELKKKLDLTKDDFQSLQNTFDKINTELNNNIKTLKHINNDIAINKQKITEIRNDIFSFSRLRGEVDQFAIKLALKYDNLQKSLNTLSQNKDLLTKSIEENSILTKQAVIGMADDEIVISDMRETLEQLTHQKKIISNDIGRRLSKTSLDRDEIEKKFFALNQRFVRHIEERKEVNLILLEIDQPVKVIRNEVDRLKGDLSILNDLKDIPGTKQSVLDHIAKLEGESKSIDLKIADIKTQIPQKLSEIETLTKKNMERRSTLNALEREIGAFEKVYSMHNNTKISIIELQRSREDLLKEMETMLAHSIELEERLSMMETMARAVVKEKAIV
ncbi:MAG: hypothetical protein HQK91_06565 [Nitrospirae bacterium]|nr:hypothetical protein [Nitrospirota bacterium]